MTRTLTSMYNDGASICCLDYLIKEFYEEYLNMSNDEKCKIFDTEYLKNDIKNEIDKAKNILIHKKLLTGNKVCFLAELTSKTLFLSLGAIELSASVKFINYKLKKSTVYDLLREEKVNNFITTLAVTSQFSYIKLQNFEENDVIALKTPDVQPIVNLDTIQIPDRSLINYEKYVEHIGQAAIKNAITVSV